MSIEPLEVRLFARAKSGSTFQLDEPGLAAWQAMDDAQLCTEALRVVLKLGWIRSLQAERIVGLIAATLQAFPELGLIFSAEQFAQQIATMSSDVGAEERLGLLLLAWRLAPNAELTSTVLSAGMNMLDDVWLDDVALALDGNDTFQRSVARRVLRIVAAQGRELEPEWLGRLAAWLAAGRTRSNGLIGQIASGITTLPDVRGLSESEEYLRRGSMLVSARKLLPQRASAGSPGAARPPIERLERLRRLLAVTGGQTQRILERSPSAIMTWPEYVVVHSDGIINAAYLLAGYAKRHSHMGGLQASEQKTTAFCHGPYMKLAAGRWRVTFHGRVNARATLSFTISQHLDPPKLFSYVKRTLEPSAVSTAMMSMEIHLDQPAEHLEYVIVCEAGRYEMILDSVEVRSLSRREPDSPPPTAER